jgi:hypothetical protein
MDIEQRQRRRRRGFEGQLQLDRAPPRKRAGRILLGREVELALRPPRRFRELAPRSTGRVERALQQRESDADPPLRRRAGQVRDRERDLVGGEAREQRGQALDLVQPPGERGDVARRVRDLPEERRQRVPT